MRRGVNVREEQRSGGPRRVVLFDPTQAVPVLTFRFSSDILQPLLQGDGFEDDSDSDVENEDAENRDYVRDGD